MDRVSEYTFFQRRHTHGQQAHGKMLNVTSYQENANQNQNEISHHTCQNGIIKKTTNNKCWPGCGEKGTLMHYWWGYKLMQPLW